MQWQDFNPTFIVDVTDSWKQRMESILAFRSQFHDPASPDPPTALSSPDFFDFIETRAKYYGDRIGVGFGEAFYSEKIPGVADLYTLL